MNSKITYLIEEFIHKYNDEPNLILIPKDMIEFEDSIIRWRYFAQCGSQLKYTKVISLEAMRCDYINEIQILKAIK